MVLITVLFTAITLQACQTEEDFAACPMTDKMLTDCNDAIPVGQDQCSGDESFCGATCIVGNHPYCGDGPCILYRNRDIADAQDWKSTPFCAQACTTTLDCPLASTCRPVPALKKPCTSDANCTSVAPWAVCEADGFCTWSTCIPDAFGVAVTE
jgi:hypothetical protein